jgi:hypothetical protein
MLKVKKYYIVLKKMHFLVILNAESRFPSPAFSHANGRPKGTESWNGGPINMKQAMQYEAGDGKQAVFRPGESP